MDLSNSSLDFIDTLPAPKAVDDRREFAKWVLARLNAGWDFSSPNFRFVAWDNTPEQRKRAAARNKYALAIQRELMQRAEEAGTPA